MSIKMVSNHPLDVFVRKVMLQGDMNALGTFKQIMSNLFSDYLGQFIWVYIDDILINSEKQKKTT